MQSFRVLIRQPAIGGYGLQANQRCLHTCVALQKYVTDTEMVHRAVMYGHEGFPSRPNEPRVPMNPEFGITLLDKQANNAIPEFLKTKTVSRAMQIYLERAMKHNEFMNEKIEEFELGKRHLANIMGVNENAMTQDEIDTAIRYLMPSGLFDYRARPRMRPAKEIYPSIKDAQFHPDGRPFHTLFYTGKANFYQACFDLESEFTKLREHQVSEQKLGIVKPPKEAKIDLSMSEWISAKEVRQMFLEKVDAIRYSALINALERLAEHPYSARASEFIMKFRKPLKVAVELLNIEPLKYDENGRAYMNAEGRRKHTIAKVTVRANGTGKVDINGKDILYFEHITDREQIMTPLKFVGLLGKVDIECKTIYEEESYEFSEDAPAFKPNQEKRMMGTSTQSGAIRYALSLALKSFVDKETVEKMRVVGLLTPDFRQKERKKWGQEGARRKFTWKRR